MRTAKHIPALVFALICFAAASANAETTTTHLRREGVFASFTDVEGDIRTFVTVFALNNRENEAGAGGPVEGPSFHFTIAQQSVATGESLMQAFSLTAEQTLSVSHNLSSATLQADVEMADPPYFPFFLSINMSWTSTGEPVTEHSVDEFSAPGFRFHGVLKQTQQEAVATGTMIGLGMNFTPTPSDSAGIFYVKGNSHTTRKQ